MQFDVTIIARIPLGELLAFGSIPFFFDNGARVILPIIVRWAGNSALTHLFTSFLGLAAVSKLPQAHNSRCCGRPSVGLRPETSIQRRGLPLR